MNNNTGVRLNAGRLEGIWAGVTLSWDSDNWLDESSYGENLRRAVSVGAHGIYTSGSTGEFYSLDVGEFRHMVDIAAEICEAQSIPLQIGCCADSTGKTIQLLEYAASKQAVGAAQVVIPYWMDLNDRELSQYFEDLYNACPDLPLVHYNIPRAKRFLHGGDYLRLLEVAPNIIGVKYTMAGSHFGELQTDMLATPDISYFVGESLLASAMQLGARGCYSSVICTQPAYILELYALALEGKWEKAIAMQQKIARLFDDAEQFVESIDGGVSDPVFDKGLGIASGFLTGHQRCRAPYTGWDDETLKALRDWLERKYPEFVFHGTETPTHLSNSTG